MYSVVLSRWAPVVLCWIWSNSLLPLGSLVYLLFTTWDFGWGFDKYRAEANEGVGLKVPAWIRGYVKYILPIMIMGLFIQGIWVKFFA